MRAIFALLAINLAIVLAIPAEHGQRIIGGDLTTIDQYPYIVAVLSSRDLSVYTHDCGGSILTTTAVLSAAHCFFVGNSPANWRVRVGSTWANSGGTVHTLTRVIDHPNFNMFTIDNDITVLRTATSITYGPNVQSISIAGPNYVVADNQVVWAAGWGYIAFNGPASEQLRHVQIWSVNQAVCRSRYAEIGMTITDNMMCAGWLDVGGRGQCSGDSGGPLVHNNVLVGVCSFGYQCGLSRHPNVNARVSRFTAWIQANAA